MPAPVFALLFAAVVLSYLAVLYAGVLTRSSPQGAFDFPEDGATVSAVVDVRGWAIDTAASGGTGVDRVQVFLDDQLLGDATYGSARPEIEARFGRNFGASGWSMRLDPSSAAAGAHTLTARAHRSVSGNEISYSRSLLLRPVGAPMGAIDTPADGATVFGATEVSGWAIDRKAASTTGIEEVSLFIDDAPVAGVTYGLPRPDVESSFGPQFAPSGWIAQVDAQALQPGQHVLRVRARSTFSGEETTYERSLVVAVPTAPRGAFDFPEPGLEVSGVTEVRGWALDEAATDGSGVDRVELFVDARAAGAASYGTRRPDIASAYGGRFERSGWAGEIDLSNRPSGRCGLCGPGHCSGCGG